MFYLSILSFFSIGAYLSHRNTDNTVVSIWLNRYILCIALPAVIFNTIPYVDVSSSAYFALFAPWLGFLATGIFMFVVGRWFDWPLSITIVAIILGGLGNTAFLGLSIVSSVFGSEALLAAIIYDQLGSFIILSVLAIPLIAIAQELGRNDVSGSKAKFFNVSQLTLVVWRIISFPPFVSLLLAFSIPVFWPVEGWSNSVIGAIFVDSCTFLAKSLMPIAMVLVGLSFRWRIESDMRLPLIFILLCKLVLPPLTLLILVHLLNGELFSIDTDYRNAMVFQSAMPPMVTPAILLIAANVAPRFVSTVLTIGTLVSAVTLPVVYKLIIFI